jgi:eukaryotic-like serine/threonine-protein kinase
MDGHDAPPPSPPPPAFGEPGHIGGYRILGVLGEGGMGVVYLAEQTEPVRREVALKVLKPGMDSRQVVARFESERQALAVMEHPGIAQVYDAGATPEGRPFFVMERVDGVPITDYCDAALLPVRARVELFLQVCSAVQHAHQKGVIHRDLKPSNVLVTVAGGAPLCKVIDFGIAKATERDAEATRVTRVDQSPGTPAYMSPEQAAASGLDVDTRSDIYSLGVLLFELLTGALPFDDQAYRGLSFLAHHVAVDPPTPSGRLGQLGSAADRVAAARSTDTAGLRRALRRDLDWIVHRAMEKDRARRYETANALALELERYLRHEPVLAGPPTTAYRAGKFVRRHRAAVAFAGTVALLLVGFGATMAVQANRIARARAVAELRQGQAEDLIGFMVGDLRQRLAPIGRLDVLDEVGRKALEYFAAVPESELSDEELFRRSEALMQLGQVRFDQDDRDAALASFREALALAKGLEARGADAPERQLGIAFAHYWVGFLHFRNGAPDSALVHFLPYVAIAERLVARHPDSARFRAELAYAHGNVGSALEARNDLEGAGQAYGSVAAVWEELSRAEPENRQWLLSLAANHNKRAVVQRKQGDLRGAVAHHRAELAARRRAHERDSTDAHALRLHALAHNFLSEALAISGEEDAAFDHRMEAVRLYRALVAIDSTHAGYRQGLGFSTRFAGLGLAARGRTAEGHRSLLESRRTFETLLAGDPGNFIYRRELAAALTALAQLANQAGPAALTPQERRGAGAADQAQLALVALEPALALRPDDADLRRVRAEALLELGRARSAGGRDDDARAAWLEAVAMLEPVVGDHASAPPLAAWAAALLELGRAADARPALERLRAQGYHTPGLAALARRHGFTL